MKIETKEDWNMVLEGCGCCPMPLCPVPTMECESVNGYANASGLFLNGDGVRHANKVYSGTGSDTDAATDNVYMVWDGFGFSGTIAGADYTDWESVVVDALVFTEQYDPPIETSICGNTVQNVYSYFCSGTKSITTTTYVGVYKAAPSPDYAVFPAQVVQELSTLVAGEETQEHIQWELDSDAWDILWPGGPSQWQAAEDARNAWEEATIAYQNWEADRDAWVAEDLENRLPEDYPVEPPPDPGAEPPDPGDPRPVEPDEFYPPCTYKTEITTTNYEISVDGSDGWINSVVGVPDVFVTYSNTSPNPISPTITYEIPVTKEDVTAALLGLFAAVDFDNCPSKGSSCAAVGIEGDFQQSATKARFRWAIPTTWKGSHYKRTWDIIEEPDGWDDPSPTVFRSFVLPRDRTWEWTGPGDPEDPDSWKSPWFEIEPPSVPGTRSVVNIRTECYRSTKFGNKPQVTGRAVELPDP